MRRREFITLLGGAAAWPLRVHAQQANVRTIGVLVRASPGWQRFWRLFPAALHDLGYIDGTCWQRWRDEYQAIARMLQMLHAKAAPSSN